MFMYKAYKLVLIEPKKGEAKFEGVATRFRSELHPQSKFNDQVCLIAIASVDIVLVYAVSQTRWQLLKQIESPEYIPPNSPAESGECCILEGVVPQVTWGYGHSPIMKDKCYATLAVAWGPLVQLFVVNDLNNIEEPLIDDGHYLLQPNQTQPFEEKEA